MDHDAADAASNDDIRASFGVSEANLRRAQPADAAALALLGGATFLESYARDHPGDALIRHVQAQHSPAFYAQMLADPACATWVLETDLGAPVGYALLTKPDLGCETGADDLELKRLYLLRGWQAGGWGRRLLAAVEAEAATRGAGRLLLCVSADNATAQRFYWRHGYDDVGRQHMFGMGGRAYHGLIWAKRLGGDPETPPAILTRSVAPEPAGQWPRRWA
ncbi:GNAT family N-acetyltransferase [Sphingomonas sp.]|uniref:GNAT family N-acetyltransferase n=1 Tax=Sphingomonas sp. TaxID=28214 RepID=UPI003B3AC5DC